MGEGPRKIVLAYSGGLDTSVAAAWLGERYDAQVACVTVDVGQGVEETGELRQRALAAGAVSFHCVDAREEFLEGFVWPTLRAGAVYARKYLLGTAMARPLIARELVRVAREEGADALAHGCTGKGNDQVRFELTFAYLAPDLQVIAPWREWAIRGRRDALEYATSRGLPLPTSSQSRYSRDRNLWHISHEGGPLEDPAFEPEESMYRLTRAPEDAPAEAQRLEIGFLEGRPASVDGRSLPAVELLEVLNEIAGRHGIGRADIVEDRMVGLKSRGVYETPGGTLLHLAHRELEQLVLDRRTLSLKDSLASRYAELVYEGRWWGTEREALDALVDVTQRRVTGTVALRLYRGGAQVIGRSSPHGLYRADLVSFEAGGSYRQEDATGFIRLVGLPYRVAGRLAEDAAPSGRNGGSPSAGDRPAALAG